MKKAYTLTRDNTIIYLLNHIGWAQSANVFNWITTETSDVVILLLAGKIGISSLEGKMLALLIFSFII
jgi:hypothetical protein